MFFSKGIAQDLYLWPPPVALELVIPVRLMPANAYRSSNSALFSFKVYPSIIIKFYLVNFFVLFLTIFGLEAGVSAIASERFDFHVSRKF